MSTTCTTCIIIIPMYSLHNKFLDDSWLYMCGFFFIICKNTPITNLSLGRGLPDSFIILRKINNSMCLWMTRGRLYVKFGLFYPYTCNYLLIIVFFTYKMFFISSFFCVFFLYVWFTRALNVAKNYSLILF